MFWLKNIFIFIFLLYSHICLSQTTITEDHVWDNVIVGAGLSGITMAERLANELNENVLIIEKRDHIGGNCYDYKDENGFLVQKYGPHIFHTDYENVWNYLSQFTKWRYFFYKANVMIDNQPVPLPFNFNTLYKIFPPQKAKELEIKLTKTFPYGSRVPILELQKTNDSDLKMLSDFIFEKIFLNYTIKQWDKKPNEISKETMDRVPIVMSRNDGYFNDKYQAVPLNGYTEMMKNMISNKKITVLLNTDFNTVKDKIKYKRMFYTGSIDSFFQYSKGILPYRSLTFDTRLENTESFQPTGVVNYPNNYDFTRITEHKKITGIGPQDKTLISIEYPHEFKININERYYPINSPQNNALYQSYIEMAKKTSNVWFLGRLGDYKYYDMDEAVLRALTLFEEVKKEN